MLHKERPRAPIHSRLTDISFAGFNAIVEDGGDGGDGGGFPSDGSDVSWHWSEGDAEGDSDDDDAGNFEDMGGDEDLDDDDDDDQVVDIVIAAHFCSAVM